MYFCFIYGPFQGLRMFKIICYVDDIIGSDVQGHGLIYAWYIKLPLLCSYVSTLFPSMFIGFYGWSCFLTMLCFFFICYRFDAFLTFLRWKTKLTISSWKAWVINWTSSFFIVACQVLLMMLLILWLFWGGRGVYVDISSDLLLRSSRGCAWFIAGCNKIMVVM